MQEKMSPAESVIRPHSQIMDPLHHGWPLSFQLFHVLDMCFEDPWTTFNLTGRCKAFVIVQMSVVVSQHFHFQKPQNKSQTISSFSIVFWDENRRLTRLSSTFQILPCCTISGLPWRWQHDPWVVALQLFLSPPAHPSPIQTSQYKAQPWVETTLLFQGRRNGLFPALGYKYLNALSLYYNTLLIYNFKCKGKCISPYQYLLNVSVNSLNGTLALCIMILPYKPLLLFQSFTVADCMFLIDVPRAWHFKPKVCTFPFI